MRTDSLEELLDHPERLHVELRSVRTAADLRALLDAVGASALPLVDDLDLELRSQIPGSAFVACRFDGTRGEEFATSEIVAYSISENGFPAIGAAHVGCGPYSRTSWFRSTAWTFRESPEGDYSSNAIVYDAPGPAPFAAANVLTGPARNHVRDLLGGAALIAPFGYRTLLDAATAFVFRDHPISLRLDPGGAPPREFSHYEWHEVLTDRPIPAIALTDSLSVAVEIWARINDAR